MPRVSLSHPRSLPTAGGLSPVRQLVENLEGLIVSPERDERIIWHSGRDTYLLALPEADYVTLGLTADDHRNNAGVALLARAPSGNAGVVSKVGCRLAGLFGVQVALANAECFMLAAARDTRGMLHQAYYARATMAGVRTTNLAELPEGVLRKNYAGSKDYEGYQIFTALCRRFARHNLPDPERPEAGNAHRKAGQQALSLARPHAASGGELAL